MAYYQTSNDTTTYDISSRFITQNDNIYIGMKVRFSYPNYGYNGEKGFEKLTLNNVYVVQDYTLYMDMLSFNLAKFPGIQFDSSLFTLESNNYIIPYGRRRTKFFIEKFRLRARLWLSRWC